MQTLPVCTCGTLAATAPLQTFPYTARVDDTKQNIFGTLPEIASLKTFFSKTARVHDAKEKTVWYPGKDCLLAITCKLREAQFKKLVKQDNAVYDNDTLASVVCDTLVCDNLATVVCDTPVCDALASVACRLRLFILCKLFTRVPGARYRRRFRYPLLFVFLGRLSSAD